MTRATAVHIPHTLLPAFAFERGTESQGLLLTRHHSSERGPALECQTQLADWPCSLLRTLQALNSYSCILNPSTTPLFKKLSKHPQNSAHESQDSSRIHQSHVKEPEGQPVEKAACRSSRCPPIPLSSSPLWPPASKQPCFSAF